MPSSQIPINYNYWRGVGITEYKTLIDSYFKVKGANDFTKDFLKLLQEVQQNLTKIWEKPDDYYSKLARSAGLSYENISEYYNKLARKKDLIKDLSVSEIDIAKTESNLWDTLGRKVHLTSEQLKNYIAVEQVLGKDGSDIIEDFLAFGMDVEKTSDILSELYNYASENGLNIKNITKDIRVNVAKISSYTFQNGVNGFTKMAQRAAEVGAKMETAFKFADKVDNIQKSIETGAHLQVLGGAFTQNANPMEMLYESMMDPEALQERMIRTFKDLGKYNDSTGKVDYSVFNRLRIKEAASQMGITPEDAYQMINTIATKEAIENKISGLGLGSEYLDLIKNTASIKNGRVVISIDGDEKIINPETGGLGVTAEELDKYKKIITSKNDGGVSTLLDIAKTTRSIEELIKGKDYSIASLGMTQGIAENGFETFRTILSQAGDDLVKNYEVLIKNAAGEEQDNLVTELGHLNTLIEEMNTFTSIGDLKTAVEGFDISSVDGNVKAMYQLIKDTASEININDSAIEIVKKFEKAMAGSSSYAQAYSNIKRGEQIYLGGTAPDPYVEAIEDAVSRTLDGQYYGGPVTVAHDNGGALQPATASARELVSNGGFTNNYYNQLGPVVNTQWGPERMLTKSHAMGNSIGTNEYVLSSKALANMGDGNIEKGVQKADMINFGGVKPFATGGEIKISERPTAYYGGGALTSSSSINASGNINVTMPNLGGRITVALEGTNKNKEFDINANADAILNAIIPKLDSHIQRVFLNAPGQGENLNNNTRWIG